LTGEGLIGGVPRGGPLTGAITGAALIGGALAGAIAAGPLVGGALVGGRLVGDWLACGALSGRCGPTPGRVIIVGGAATAGVFGIGRGALGCAAPCATGPGVCAAGRCGKPASSEIFWVGATRGPEALSRAPQPPQNRESGAFSVPQLAQRIPSQA